MVLVSDMMEGPSAIQEGGGKRARGGLYFARGPQLLVPLCVAGRMLCNFASPVLYSAYSTDLVPAGVS